MGEMMDSDSIFLGIDFGTGGCKITAISEEGVLVGEASTEYPTEFAHPGWSEQNPDDWYSAMIASLGKIREKGVDFRRVRAIAFDGSTHNAVLLDGLMRPLRKTIMWTDQRSTEECAFLRNEYGEHIFQTAYQMPAPTWTLPQMMWLKAHEPEILKRTRHVLFVKDYVRYLVTGIAVTDYIEAQGTLFFDMNKMEWSKELVAMSSLPMDALPELVKPSDLVGQVTAKAARETGIPEGTPVVCGTSDSAAEDYGAGAIEPGDCIVKLATAGNVNVMTSEPHPFKTTLTYSHVVSGMWYTVSATNAAALCQRWFRDTFCELEKAEATRSESSAFELMNRLTMESAPGAKGVVFHPYLQGERSPYWDSKLRASFTGVSISSTKGDFIRALLEGVAYSLRDCFGTIEEMKLPVRRIFLIGGGARGRLWSEIVCNVFNLPVSVPTPGDASFGTALLAATGVGLFSDCKSAVRKCLHIDREIQPCAELAELYAKGFGEYREIHDALAEVYARR
ncbi:MAG: xylulokinase [Victivallales bacterium]|nr:xylulokinase [Victivallales bacterium]